MCDVQSIRWVLGSLNGSSGPVSTRAAQAWCSRMEHVGLIERANLGAPGGSWLWGTYEATGQSRPNVYTQTARHEVAVAAVSARYLAAGFGWQRDDKPPFAGGHQADGVALGRRSIELIEVELTPKRAPRYASIFTAFQRRLDYGDANRVDYLCTEPAARAVRRSLSSSPSGRAVARFVSVRTMFDSRGGIAP
ncbi:hypothetical protein [uncultured Amnibacterium sp.]|uniref:hypothetical protein n=1 Tax=uncultured Amnibacterium sp. TaxID=1631851 RepID=UPI0035CBCC60